jgi:replicative DNA helicase
MKTGILTRHKKIEVSSLSFQNGELILLSSKASKGKTALALSLASGIAINRKRNIAYFSLEASSGALHERLLSSGRITDTGTKSMPLCIDDTPRMTISGFKHRIRELKAEHKAEIAFIDYLPLLENDDASLSRNERTIDIMTVLKALAVETGMPIIALLQVSKDTNQATNQDEVLEHSDLLIHFQQSGSGKWKLRVTNRLNLVK